MRRGVPPDEPVRRLPVGIAALDALLGGGLPRGHVSEVVGGPSSGRTAVLYAALASATRAGEVAAVVDLPDALDPRSLARAGADLARILWVRPPSLSNAFKCAELVLDAGGFGLVALDLDSSPRALRWPVHAVWSRLTHAVRRAGTVTVIVAPHRLAGSRAALALRLTQRRIVWSGPLLEGIAATAALERSRFSPAEQTILLTRWSER